MVFGAESKEHRLLVLAGWLAGWLFKNIGFPKQNMCFLKKTLKSLSKSYKIPKNLIKSQKTLGNPINPIILMVLRSSRPGWLGGWLPGWLAGWLAGLGWLPGSPKYRDLEV